MNGEIFSNSSNAEIYGIKLEFYRKKRLFTDFFGNYMTDPKNNNFPKYYLGLPIQRHQDHEDRLNFHRDMRFSNMSLALNFLIYLN